MLNIRQKPLFVFSLVFILIFSFAAAAQDKEPAVTKNPPKKPVVSKPGKIAPKLKSAADTVKTGAKEKAPAAHEKTETKEAATKIEPKEKYSAEKTETKEKTVDSAKTEIKKKTPASGVKTASKESAAKTETKEKSVSPAASPAAKKAGPKKKITPVVTAAKKVKAKEKPAAPVTTAKKAEAKKKPAAPVTTAKKAEAKEKPAAAAAPAKKVEPKKKPATATATAAAPGLLKVWLPRVTADKVKADINGTTIADVASEESGDGTMDWLFAANQLKEIEILKTNQKGDELTVEARLSAKKAKPNWDGSFDRLRGTARLYYTRGSGKWELKSIDNISLRHSDTNMDSPLPGSAPAYPAPQTAALSVISAPPFNILPSAAAVNIAAGNYQSFSFRVEDKAVVTGRFQAQGGRQNDIETYILDQDGFLNWSNGHNAPAYYNSGRLTVGTIETPLGAGTYYLVFNNRYSRADNKLVEASIQLRMDTYIGAGGAGTINTIRRVYAPAANPAPSYILPPEVVERVETPEKSERIAARDTNTSAATRPAVPINQPAIKPQIAIAGYESDAIFSDTFNVEGQKHYAIPFTVKPGGTVRGTFSVAGRGSERGDSNIDAYIMTAGEYFRWSNYHEAVLDYSSGRVANGRIDRKLGPGDYYLVFSNHFSPRGSKTVEAEIHVEYLPR